MLGSANALRSRRQRVGEKFPHSLGQKRTFGNLRSIANGLYGLAKIAI